MLPLQSQLRETRCSNRRVSKVVPVVDIFCAMVGVSDAAAKAVPSAQNVLLRAMCVSSQCHSSGSGLLFTDCVFRYRYNRG